MRVRLLVSGTALVGVCFLGAACGESGSDDDSGDDAQAGMPSGGTAGTGSGGTSGGTGGGGGTTSSGGAATGGASGSASGSGGTTGGSGGTAGTGNTDLPDIDPNKLVSDLSDPEKAELCDWMVGLLGGYGMTMQFPAGSVSTYPSQEVCVAAGLSFRCDTVTVGDVEACQLSMVPSGGCDSSDPSCDALHCT